MTVDDMCKDYKTKFKIKFDKLREGQCQLGMFLNIDKFYTYYGYETEKYLYICLFKICISIGWLISDVNE